MKTLARTTAGHVAGLLCALAVLLPSCTTTSSLSAPDRYDLICRRIPYGRWGEPEELQGTTVFLASHASDYVTGAVIPVDGGYSVM